jgi:hypothetical protein
MQEQHAADETNYLADAFSARVARDFPRQVWQSLFVDRSEAVRLRPGTWSVVCAESTWDGRLSQDQVRSALAGLAANHGGHADAGPGPSLAAFADPDAALRAALALQRLTADARLRIGVVTVHAGLAQFRREGATVNLLVGEPQARASLLLHAADPGTVQLCAVTYGALAGFNAELDACVVMAEYEGDELTQVTLTLPPPRGEFLSTFAGLGLT